MRAAPGGSPALPALHTRLSSTAVPATIGPVHHIDHQLLALVLTPARPGPARLGRICFFLASTAALLAFTVRAPAGDAQPSPRPLKVLYLAGGGFHDYATMVPRLTNRLSRLGAISFQTHFDLEPLRDPSFGRDYDAVIYDVCFEEAPDQLLENALQTVRQGKPAVMLHCAVHAFRHSPKIRDWETCCGMRSKVHDPYASFTVTNLDPASPITASFPAQWTTPGDELYQTISIDPQSHPLLRAKSPKDGREHIVCWTCQFGEGRVFATTLGHDQKTASAPEYQRLVLNGLLWACRRLGPDGLPLRGTAPAPAPEAARP